MTVFFKDRWSLDVGGRMNKCDCSYFHQCAGDSKTWTAVVYQTHTLFYCFVDCITSTLRIVKWNILQTFIRKIITNYRMFHTFCTNCNVAAYFYCYTADNA